MEKMLKIAALFFVLAVLSCTVESKCKKHSQSKNVPGDENVGGEGDSGSEGDDGGFYQCINHIECGCVYGYCDYSTMKCICPKGTFGPLCEYKMCGTEIIFGKTQLCCNQTKGYTVADEWCCNGKVVPKPRPIANPRYPYAYACCGDAAYYTRGQECINGEIRIKKNWSITVDRLLTSKNN